MTVKERRPTRRQRGAALLMAMIILTLVATLAAGMVWQQSTSVAIETAERARAQSTWILNGALDWSRIILREDARNGGADHLGEPWATPLAEARLSTFLAADKDNTGDGDLEAFLSGSIEDAQSRYNLRRLVSTNAADNASIQAQELKTLEKLFELIELPAELASTIATGLRAAWNPAGATAADNAPLAPQTLAQLRWLGVDEASIQRMQPYVTVLPKPTAVNLNTAPREVIAAVVPGLDLGSADRLVQRRVSNPFKDVDEAKALLPPNTDFGDRAGVKSDYFEVRGRLRLGDQVQEEVALMERRQAAIVPLWRTRSQSLKNP